MSQRISDAELKVMNVLWREGDITAKQISDILNEKVGWHINTTYTIINNCIKKGMIERRKPKFICHALVDENEAISLEANDFADRFFEKSIDKLFVALAKKTTLSEDKINEIMDIINGKAN